MSRNSERSFQILSYAAVFCGFLTLWVSGTFGILGTLSFLAVFVIGWKLEGRSWQVSERLGTTLMLVAMPVFYLAFRLQLIGLDGGQTIVAGVLSRLILALTGIKLLQKKSERDWIFLYLMSFFEVMLAAGLSISASYFGSLLLYLLAIVCAVIAFEIRKTSRTVDARIGDKGVRTASRPLTRIPSTAVTLILLILVIAFPLFLILPRVSGAGFGGDQTGLKTSTGFSDTVRLGNIGRIQQSDAIVMRVKIEGDGDGSLYFRGTALDTFDNRAWSRSRSAPREPLLASDGGLIRVGSSPVNREALAVQTVCLEPMDTSLIFGLPRIVAIEGNFPTITRDSYDSLTFQHRQERISYEVLSDRSLPAPDVLRSDEQPYTADIGRYRQLPELLDPRIADLASTAAGGAKNRFDIATNIQNYLRSNYSYTLELKAGGEQPLADFLFNVRQGHCEYFASALAVMLRTQGIATRVVNGFHGGDYNDAAGVTVVRERNAHSWVEVYFPKEDVWVPFDATPAVNGDLAQTNGIAGLFRKYAEALDTLWIEHVISYDGQGQRSLARTFRNSVLEYQASISFYLSVVTADAAEWWRDLSGSSGMGNRLSGLLKLSAFLLGLVVIVLAIRWLMPARKRRLLGNDAKNDRPSNGPVISFYERLVYELKLRGLERSPAQTPLEFAYATSEPDVIWLVEQYHRVRFGGAALTELENQQVEAALEKVSSEQEHAS